VIPTIIVFNPGFWREASSIVIPMKRVLLSQIKAIGLDQISGDTHLDSERTKIMNQSECDTQNQCVQIEGNNGEGQESCDTQLMDVPSDDNGTGVHKSHDTHSPCDTRPDPKPRKHPHLWQAYLWWYELMEMRKRHNSRISSIENGKSNLDAGFEREMIAMLQLDILVDPKNKTQRAMSAKQIMVNYGEAVGPIWDWCLAHKGMGESLTAQLLAQIDDINNSPSVSSLWRFAGFSIDGGKAEKNHKGVKSPFNHKLKGICFNIADQFIRQQTPYYVDIYYAEKQRQRELYPEPVCRGCGELAVQKRKKVRGKMVMTWGCPENGKHVVNYTDAHLHIRGWRKMIKEFLKDLWVAWRRIEGQIE